MTNTRKAFGVWQPLPDESYVRHTNEKDTITLSVKTECVVREESLAVKRANLTSED
jgi:hypothetical protein